MTANRRNVFPEKREGAALVLVLSFLVLISALVLAFFSSVTTELSGAKNYAGEMSANQLADSAVQNVMGTIRLATSGTASDGSITAWASQPGMIRTYNNQGTPIAYYKLYSSGTMVTVSYDPANDVDTQWASKPAQYVDLNAPLTSGTSVLFPIVDGNNIKSLTVGGSSALTYSSDGSTQDVAGFAIDPAKVSYNATQSLSIANTPVPMPVKWIYVLKDGTLTVPTGIDTSGKKVNWTGAPTSQTPSASNPITGRIAFWTDDDTNKVNINTAAEGTYWDTPRGATVTDQALASYQPAQKEYQRYPGHPAMTSLSTVFPKSLGLTDQQWAEQIYAIVPRITGSGSKEGTVMATGTLAPDSDRLFGSLPELLFKPTLSGSERDLNYASVINRNTLEQKKFFLTAHSRAPELNLFNLPRVACWPIYQLSGTDYDTTHTTAFDRLIGTCSTANGYPYFFQRRTPLSPTADIGITRNTNLYTYLQSLTQESIPGFGGDFKAKYGDDRDQILTEIFDYIRCANLCDDNVTTPYTPASGAGHGFVAPVQYGSTQGIGRTYTLSKFGIGFICNAVAADATTSGTDYGSNDPATNKVLGGTKLNTGDKYIQAIIAFEFFSPMQGWASIIPDMQVEITGIQNLSVTDSSGTPQSLGFPYDGTVSYNATANNMYGGRASGGNPGWRYCVFSKGAPARGSVPGDTASASIPNYPFIGVPVKIKASASGGTMGFVGSSAIVVKLYAGSSALMQTININLPSSTFPIPNLVNQGTQNTSIGTTSKENWWSFPRVGGVTISGSSYTGRLNNVSSHPTLYTDSSGKSQIDSGAFFYDSPPGIANIANFDVIRTVLPAHGDYRLIAAQPIVPPAAYAKHRYYDDSSKMAASNFANSNNPQVEPGYDLGGTYFPSAMPWTKASADIPAIATGTNVPETTGDFDSSLPNFNDGPFINKPDEGNTYGLGTSGAIPYYSSYSVQAPAGPTFFSPNRIMPSPGMFGSLPTGVKSGTPWRTLLFRPQPGHFGANTPRDHLIMDLFWMPVVEPYAISDRFSTAGKINMNYQMAPFTYMTRNTGLRALLKSEKLTAIPNGTSNGGQPGYSNFKQYSTSAISPSATQTEARLAVDADETLKQFQTRFTAGNLFISPSEICDLHIVPSGQTVSSMSTFWSGYAGTGDNERERVYTTLYPRLTTKSNTYTVHFRAQALVQTALSKTGGTWTEGKDTVVSESRGATTVERYLDPSDTTIPDYADGTSPFSKDLMGNHYRWRILETQRFAP
ncbi:MAG: Verru_Chthon cassette protein A [Chthoniobacteraceae bacterium]